MGSGATVSARRRGQNRSMRHRCATMSNEKWGGRGGRPHLGFDGCGVVAAYSRDGEPFFFKLGDGVGDALFVLWPRHGVGRLQWLPVVLLVQAAGHGRRQWLVSDGDGLVKKAAADLELQKGATGEVFIG
jgi:hypothetical protein